MMLRYRLSRVHCCWQSIVDIMSMVGVASVIFAVSSITQLGCKGRCVRCIGDVFFLNHRSRWIGSGFSLKHRSQCHSLFFVWDDHRTKASQLKVCDQNAHKREHSAQTSEDDGESLVFHCCLIDGIAYEHASRSATG
jgi:hypothetical protein